MVMVSCSVCGHAIDVPDSLKGTDATCPQCGAPNPVLDDDDWFDEYINSPTDAAIEQAAEISKAESYRRYHERSSVNRSAQTISVLYGIYWLLAILVCLLVFHFDPAFGAIAAVGFIVAAIIRLSIKSAPRH